jgi:carbamoyl-phosphate synthase small subunit
MKYNKRPIAYLVLGDGTVFEGQSIGKVGTTTGEICFNTSMTGYQEIYTDPSYFGQIIINTTSHIGNYGVADVEIESGSIKFSGLVCKTYSEIASRKMSDGSLQDYFESNDIVGISEVDTRGIVRYIRDKGAMNAIISSDISDVEKLKEEVKKVPSMAGLELSSKVYTEEPYFVGDENAAVKLAVLDLGIKKSILSNFTDRGCYCKVFPGNTSYKEMKEWNPDGFFISNGPGDPAATTYAIDTVKEIIEANESVFGICLGHQIIALANGISTYKMHNGHRGANHPVKNIESGLCEITSQNHGFSIKREDVEQSDVVEETHFNLNDETVEGIKLKGKSVFSVQYHPESSPGPHDSRYLFDEFIKLLK